MKDSKEESKTHHVDDSEEFVQKSSSNLVVNFGGLAASSPENAAKDSPPREFDPITPNIMAQQAQEPDTPPESIQFNALTTP